MPKIRKLRKPFRNWGYEDEEEKTEAKKGLLRSDIKAVSYRISTV